MPCPVLFLGAGPSKGEIRSGEPYTGLAGDELNDTYLPLAGFRRAGVAVGNATLCWDGSPRTPSEDRVVKCARTHLPALLDRCKPEVVVLMGGVTQKIADMRIRLDMHHGIPQRTSLLGRQWEGWVWPSYEPALGMRDTPMMTHLLADFRRLGKWLRGEWEKPVAPVESHDYRLITAGSSGRHWRQNVKWAAVDTERHGSEMWSVQWSQKAGEGRMVRADDKESLALLAALLPSVTVSLHNAPQDLDALHKMGIDLVNIRDTMQESYHLTDTPQGLKPFVYRAFGHSMRSWEDVVWPASIAKITDWLEDAISLTSSHPIVELSEMKMGRCGDCGGRTKKLVCPKCGSSAISFTKTEYHDSPLHSILRHIHRHTVTTQEADKPYNPWKKLPEMRKEGLRGKAASDGEWDWLGEQIGPTPILGIGNCEEGEAVEYAVGDADWTGRVAGWLEGERGRREVEMAVDEEDWDQ